MIRRPPRSTRTDTLFPDTTRFRSRAYREPGVQQPDPLPAGSPAGVPRWNTNPEVVAVSSRALGGDTADVMSGCLRSEEHTSELQSLMRISYAVFCLKKKKTKDHMKNKT